jgi:peptidoglycan/LPS O-acetylase OafA/YrhL
MIKNYRNGTIDILKLISILLVIIFHFLYEFSFNNNLRVLGFIGISLFFIISGYLLAKKYPEIETFSFKWLSKRIVRIISIYYPALIILIIIFGKQIYSGSVIKNLGFHFLFIDFAS